VEDERVIDRIGHLIAIPAIVHFLSLEPFIGPLHNLPLENIQWVIVGGESGPGARPIDEDWVLEIQRQCRAAGIAFFFKQWGGLKKAKNGRALQGRFYNEIPRLLPKIRQIA
jgi:protein gp37